MLHQICVSHILQLPNKLSACIQKYLIPHRTLKNLFAKASLGKALPHEGYLNGNWTIVKIPGYRSVMLGGRGAGGGGAEVIACLPWSQKVTNCNTRGHEDKPG